MKILLSLLKIIFPAVKLIGLHFNTNLKRNICTAIFECNLRLISFFCFFTFLGCIYLKRTGSRFSLSSTILIDFLALAFAKDRLAYTLAIALGASSSADVFEKLLLASSKVSVVDLVV